jgi:ATP-dependent helicase/nuclease subunit B
MSNRARPKVFTIPSGAPFLRTLVVALFDGRLVEGFPFSEPLSLLDTTIYLPTRRAARAIREHFLTHLKQPVLLPKIRTLGDIDEEEIGIADAASLAVPAAVPPLERQLVLTKLVLGWSGALARSLADLPDEELIVPASAADAARLASSLAELMDQVGTDPAAWRGLFKGTPADLARYWDITLEFLKIATEMWPAYLAEHGLIDPGARRDLLLRREAERLLAHGSAAPVIAAGSTGSVLATAQLLAAIARLPNGAVVLPGLDRELDEESWAEVGPSERDPAGAGHPQHGLKLLLESLGITRGDVQNLGELTQQIRTRSRFVSESLRPASTTERWRERPALTADEKAGATGEVGIIEAANEREEALAVAAILRGTAERPGDMAALVTPDRGLARRVAVELKRWGILVDDSGGRPLTRTPP